MEEKKDEVGNKGDIIGNTEGRDRVYFLLGLKGQTFVVVKLRVVLLFIQV